MSVRMRCRGENRLAESQIMFYVIQCFYLFDAIFQNPCGLTFEKQKQKKKNVPVDGSANFIVSVLILL